MPEIINTNVKRDMTTRDIAGLTGARHGNVLRDTRNLIGKGAIKGTEITYRSVENGRVYPEITMNFDDAVYVMAGLGREFSASLISKLYTELERVTPEANSYIYTDSNRRSLIMRRTGGFSWPPPPPPSVEHVDALCGKTNPSLPGKTVATSGE